MTSPELVDSRQWIQYYLIIFGVFVAIFALYTGWMASYIGSDIYLHYQYIMAIIRHEKFPPANFLYYVTVACLALFQPNRLMIGGAIALVLSLSVAAKFLISYHFLNGNDRNKAPQKELLVAGIAILLLFAFCLPGPEAFLLGKLPPNLWHNSTLVFLMPFALALFFTSFRYLETGAISWLPAISICVVLNVLIKPSFFLCVVCGFPVLVLLRHGWGKVWAKSLIPLILGLILLGLEYYLIYIFVPQTAGDPATAIEIRPFYVWAYKASGNIPWAWIASVAFPLTCLCLFPGWVKEPMMQYVLVLTGVGYLIYILLVETGEREFHGNFNWQLMVCHFMWFLVSMERLLGEIRRKSRSRFVFMGAGLVFGLHVLAGFAYLIRVFQIGTAYV